jgi:DNA-binding response OmpR family regulator
VAAETRQTILVVEDNTDLRHLFRSVLSAADFNVVEASDGLAALQLIEGHRVDLVVLDLGLPILDGRDVYAELRAKTAEESPPIIVVTGRHPDELNELGAACILQKPVHPVMLVAKVRNAIEKAA